MHNVTHLMDLCSERVRHMQLIVIFSVCVIQAIELQLCIAIVYKISKIFMVALVDATLGMLRKLYIIFFSP